MLERDFQAKTIKRIKEMFPGCLVLKNDANYLQGIPDTTVFYKDKWATLEFKKSKNSPYQPNQEYYIDKMDGMSFCRMICPENQEEVLHGLQQAFLEE